MPEKMLMATDLQGFRMKEGTHDTSYAKASYLQRQVLSLTKHVKEKALKELYSKDQQPSMICIADLGCSSGEENIVSLISALIKTIENDRRELRRGPIEYQIYLNDLPGNDFNTVFRTMPKIKDTLKKQIGYDFGHCFVNGVPGSFYGRLFPSNHLRFVHSSYSLHWLSQVPSGLEDNKRNVYIAKNSPPNVLKAYHDQYENDFLTFLNCRAQEVEAGGKMVLTLLGRNTDELYSKESCYMFDFLATALNDMVNEGFIEEEKLKTFNIPMYSPSAKELRLWVEKEESFTLKQVHISEVDWVTTIRNKDAYKIFDHNDFAKCIRAVTENLITSHFGEDIVDELFDRYTEIVKVSTTKEKKNVFINVTIVLTRNG